MSAKKELGAKKGKNAFQAYRDKKGDKPKKSAFKAYNEKKGPNAFEVYRERGKAKKSTPKPAPPAPEPYVPGSFTKPTAEQWGGAQADWDIPQSPQAEDPDAMLALFQQMLDSINTDVGPGPNLNDYIGGFEPARQQARGYQQAATGKINEGTQQLLAKLQQSQQFAQSGIADVGKVAAAQTQKVAGDQAGSALLAARDLQGQGLDTAQLQAQQSQLGGQLSSTAASQDAFTGKMEQLAAMQAADRQASANTQGQGAIGQLGLNTTAQLNELNAGEAQARQKYGQDAAQHASAASNAKQQDMQTRLQLAQQFADLDAASEVDPTMAVRQQHKAHQALFDQLDQGYDPSQARVDLKVEIATEKKKPREEQDVAMLAQLEDAQRALDDWEKASRPDAKVASKKEQMAKIAKYLQPH